MAALFKAPLWPPVYTLNSDFIYDDDGDEEDDSDYNSLASAPPFSPAPSIGTSHTSEDHSMRSVSPSPSVWSMTSSLQERVYKNEYGRRLNNYSEVYRLPADDEELERLSNQHEIFKEIMGKYPPPLPIVLADDTPGETKAVLDLGCGSGSWIMEVARDFPHCSAVAVDLVPMQSLSMPPNCRSEVDDINLGLEHFYGQFNVVHIQTIASGIKNFLNLIDQVTHVLRPGGLLQIMEFDFHSYDENYQRIDPEPSTGTWWSRWLSFCKLAARNAGGDVDAASHMHSWVSQQPAFENLVYKDYWAPISPWRRDSPFQIRVGERMRDDIRAFLKSSRPLLLGNGIPEEVVNELETNTEDELAEASVPQYIRMQSLYVHKRR